MPANYEIPILSNYINGNNYSEAYALLTHAMQLSDNEAYMHYLEAMRVHNLNNGFMPTKEVLNEQLHINFLPQPQPRFTFIDLFAGIGGFRLAMQANGGTCVFSSEFDPAAKQTYFENFGEVPFGDITNPEIKEMIPEHFDVLCAGFPCQAFSIAGNRLGFDDVRGTLFFDVAEILETRRPKAFYLENVKNLKSHDNGRTFETIMDVLQNRLGYNVTTKVMNPCEYANVPQNRERIFIIGFDPDQVNLPDDYEFPFVEPVELTRTIHDIINPNENDPRLFYRPAHMYYERMRDVIVNPDTVYQWRRVYIRENQSNLCPTLTANMGEGGHNVPIITINGNIRKFSPKECIGFQGFPENYRFPDTIAQGKKYKQAGNSVTVPLITRVATQMIHELEEYSR